MLNCNIFFPVIVLMKDAKNQKLLHMEVVKMLFLILCFYMWTFYVILLWRDIF